MKRWQRFKSKVMSTRVVHSGIISATDLRKKFNIPDKASITVHVPGGGDWSNTELTIGEDIPHIDVNWEEVK